MIIYATKYGSTREYADALARELGVPAIRAEQVSALTGNEPFLVLGSPIYAFSVLPAMERLIETHAAILKLKPLAVFVVCGDTMWNPRVGEGGPKNLMKLTRLLPKEPIATAVFGGRMRMKELDEVDGPRILAFYRQIKREPTGFDRMELERIPAFAREIEMKLQETST